MSEERHNALLLLSVHKEIALDYDAIIEDYAKRNQPWRLGKWNSLPESIQNTTVLVHIQKIISHCVSFHLVSSHSNFLNQMDFHICYIPALPAGH